MARKTEIDFDDEDAVLAEIAHELDIDPDDLTIEEDSGFGVTVYEISTHSGRKSWQVVVDDDQMEELAIAVVTQDLEQEPEIFEKSFLEQHINMSRLRRDLESDVQNMNEESLRDMRDSEFWRTAERFGVEKPEDEEDENGDTEEPDPEDFVEDVAEAMTKEQLSDPMSYLEDIYGDDAVKQAIEIAGIDIKAAAEDAVSTDGPEHFLARYDGNYETSPSGFIYWRNN